VLIDEGLSLHPIEIKSGATLQNNFLKNFKFWKKITGYEGGTLFYTGESRELRSNGITVETWDNIDTY